MNQDDNNEFLLVAAKDGKIDVVRQLIDCGANIEHQCNRTGCTALLRATRHDHIDVVKLLLRSNANRSVLLAVKTIR
jgi:ankyrin repeat protein